VLEKALDELAVRTEDAVADLVRQRVRSIVKERTRRRPLVVPMVTRIDEG